MYGVPKSLLSKRVSNFFIEKLDMDVEFRDGKKFSPEDGYVLNEHGLRSNHCICRLVFPQDQQGDTPNAPGTLRGVRIDLAVIEVGEHVILEGGLNVAPFSYEGPHRRAVKSVEIQIRAGKTVGDFLQVMEDNQMIPCDFLTKGNQVHGNTDFISQFVYRLEKARMLDIPAHRKKEVYADFFNGNFGPGLNERRPNGVHYACFNGKYHARHHAIDGIVYKGGRISTDSIVRADRNPFSDSE